MWLPPPYHVYTLPLGREETDADAKEVSEAWSSLGFPRIGDLSGGPLKGMLLYLGYKRVTPILGNAHFQADKFCMLRQTAQGRGILGSRFADCLIHRNQCSSAHLHVPMRCILNPRQPYISRTATCGRIAGAALNAPSARFASKRCLVCSGVLLEFALPFTPGKTADLGQAFLSVLL